MESTAPQRPLHICLVASEVVPLAKTGGLADVVGALAAEWASLGHDVAVVLPAYRQVDALGYEMADLCTLSIPTGGLVLDVRIQQVFVPTLRVAGPGRLRMFVVRHDPFFSRPGLYQEAGRDYPDNLDRFVLFCRSVMELLLHLHDAEQWHTDVLHLHDWQAALCAVYLRTLYHTRSSLSRTRSVLTIHNLGYQGLFPAEQFPVTGLPVHLYTPAALEFYGRVNVLKGGLVFADRLTTVSPTYSQEIQTAEYGCGLEGVIGERKSVLSGIVNGIDADLWNPTADQYLSAPYTSSDLSGKVRCKQALQRELGLRPLKGPLLAVIARLTSQKGIDLVIDIFPELMTLNVQVVILGTGDPLYERQVRELGERYPGRVAVRNVFDEGLAHRIEAGADMFLMPSRYEPCGLSQLYSLRYGTVPIVRKTGGLADTVVGYTPTAAKESRATGFMFTDTQAASLLTAVLLALSVYRKKAEWHRLVKAGMEQDLSWTRSASMYLELFQELVSDGQAST
ncbi:MAG: glycogen synthase GlgA [Nitrospira sp.]|nr:glycogen synthase GlgA [Nitrospira sp.]